MRQTANFIPSAARAPEIHSGLVTGCPVPPLKSPCGFHVQRRVHPFTISPPPSLPVHRPHHGERHGIVLEPLKLSVTLPLSRPMKDSRMWGEDCRAPVTPDRPHTSGLLRLFVHLSPFQKGAFLLINIIEKNHSCHHSSLYPLCLPLWVLT